MNILRILLACASLSLMTTANAVTAAVQVVSGSPCGQPMGTLQVNVSGGVPPYTYAWSNGATDIWNFGLVPGMYSVIVTDYLLDADTAQATVPSMPAYTYTSYNEDGGYCLPEQPYVSFYAGTENGLPPDPMTGTVHGPGPYTFDAVGYGESWAELPDACSWFSYYIVSINAPPGTSVTVNYADGAGCPGTFQTTMKQPTQFPAMQVVNVTGSCSNGAIGSATVAIPAAPNGQSMTLRLKDINGTYVGGSCNATYVGAQPATHTFTQLAPGDYEAILDVDIFNQFGFQTFCTGSLWFTIPDNGTLCGQVNGRIYVDGNANCLFAGGENTVPNTLVKITPGPYYAVTNANGQYSVNLPYDTYTFTEQHPVLVQSCPVQVTVNSGTPIQNNNIGCAGGVPLDVELSMANGPARPGFQLQYALALDNLTAAATGTVTLVMTFDPELIYLSSTLSPASVVGNTITWTAPALTMTNAFQHREVHVHFQVPPDITLIGDTLGTTATISTQNADADLTNNTVTSTTEVTSSFDPNDKLVRTESGSTGLFLIGTDEELHYTIRFQNTGTDTAFTVIVTDTLPPALDLATVRMGASSHPYTWSLSGDGVLRFVFANILLPDSNVNEAASHGLVQFHVRPELPLLPGTEMSNNADIFFDFNPPVRTNDAVVVAETSTQVQEQEQGQGLRVFPNPVNDELHFAVPGGSGPYRVDVIGAEGRLYLTARTDVPMIDVSALPAGLYALRVNGVVTRFVKR